MQIIIDTKKDGPEEIRKAARLLLSLLDEDITTSAPVVPPSVMQDASGFFNMLDTPAPQIEKKMVSAKRLEMERY